MEYRNLGRAGVKVSPLCLGTMMFGPWGNTDEAECARVIHRALDAGINFIDTANIYSKGESEAIVGRALRDRREEVVLATKVWGAMGEGPNERGLSRKAIEEQVDKSLCRLQTDVIDLYQIHRPDPTTPWEETLATLTDLVRRGKVRYIGASTSHTGGSGSFQKVLPAWEMVESLWVSERRELEPFVCLQPPYSMLRRAMEVEQFPMTRRFGVGNIVWSPLEGGWLTGKYRNDQEPPDSPRRRNFIGDPRDPKFDRRRSAVEKLLPWAEEKGAPLAELAMAWTLRHPAVTSVIIGPRTEEQLDSCVRSLDHEITDEDAARIDAIVPPGTTAL